MKLAIIISILIIGLALSYIFMKEAECNGVVVRGLWGGLECVTKGEIKP